MRKFVFIGPSKTIGVDSRAYKVELLILFPLFSVQRTSEQDYFGCIPSVLN